MITKQQFIEHFERLGLTGSDAIGRLYDSFGELALAAIDESPTYVASVIETKEIRDAVHVQNARNSAKNLDITHKMRVAIDAVPLDISE